jgi:hypothetical protein
VGRPCLFGINRVEHHIEHLLEKGRERGRKVIEVTDHQRSCQRSSRLSWWSPTRWSHVGVGADAGGDRWGFPPLAVHPRDRFRVRTVGWRQ